MNVLAWVDLALRYEEENRELRAALLAVLVAAAKRDAHFAYARDLIENRFREAA